MTRATIPTRLRSLLAPALALNLFALATLCYTSPPDQTWIAGLYDDADHDDVVMEILEIIDSCAVPAAAMPHLGAPEAIRAAQPPVPAVLLSRQTGTALLDRSPPLA